MLRKLVLIFFLPLFLLSCGGGGGGGYNPSSTAWGGATKNVPPANPFSLNLNALGGWEYRPTYRNIHMTAINKLPQKITSNNQDHNKRGSFLASWGTATYRGEITGVYNPAFTARIDQSVSSEIELTARFGDQRPTISADIYVKFKDRSDLIKVGSGYGPAVIRADGTFQSVSGRYKFLGDPWESDTSGEEGFTGAVYGNNGEVLAGTVNSLYVYGTYIAPQQP